MNYLSHYRFVVGFLMWVFYLPSQVLIVSEDDLNEFESDFDTKDAVEKLKEAQLDLADAVNDMQGCEGGG